MEDLVQLTSRLESALLAVDKNTSKEILNIAVKTYSPIELANTVVAGTLENIGKAWENGTIGLSQVYMAGKICEELIDKILPPGHPVRIDQPKMGIALLEDYHILGKRIVYSALRAAGFELLDLGNGIQADDLCNKVKQLDIKILLISTLMLPSALKVKRVKENLESSNVIIVVGGAPFRLDANLWKEVGADYHGNNSSEAIEIIKKIIDGK